MQLVVSAAPSTISYACRLSETGVLCYGALHHSVGAQDIITVNGQPANKPYLGATLGEGDARQTLFLLHMDSARSVETLEEVQIQRGGQTLPWRFDGGRELAEYVREYEAFLDRLPPGSARRVLFLFLHYLATYPDVATDPVFAPLCHLTRLRVEESGGSQQEALWFQPAALYQSLWLPARPYTETKLVVTTPKAVLTGHLELAPQGAEMRAMLVQSGAPIPADHHPYAGAVFLDAPPAVALGQCRLTLFSPDTLQPLSGALPAQQDAEAHVLGVLQRLPERARLRTREHLCRAILTHRHRLPLAESAGLVAILQEYISTPHLSVYDPHQPFGMNIDHAIPIGADAVFVSGWLRDPLGLLQECTAVADLGIRFNLLPYMARYPRPDVDALYADGPYASATGDWGFAACVPMVPELQAMLQGLTELRHFRFTLSLRSGLRYTISAPRRHADALRARDDLLQTAESILDATRPVRAAQGEAAAGTTGAALPMAAEQVVYQALAGLQQQVAAMATGTGALTRTLTLGALPADPPVSVIVPLYGCYDYLQAQIAHFSQDRFLRQCEIIYVLDEPAQAEAALARLQELHALYGLPLRVLLNRRNYGYAAATNLGAAQARGALLLLLNSDVLPLEYGWAERMVTYYRAHPDTGALGVKLLYDDGSLQHAGMYFAYDATLGAYENRHYHKGYPAEFPPACQSRPVPAVTGACLMIEATLFRAVGGVSTAYVVGDFEDSDLCLACMEAGRTNRYLAEVSLYHLERQSVAGHVSHRSRATYRCNIAMHHARWQPLLDRLAEGEGNGPVNTAAAAPEDMPAAPMLPGPAALAHALVPALALSNDAAATPSGDTDAHANPAHADPEHADRAGAVSARSAPLLRAATTPDDAPPLHAPSMVRASTRL